MGFRGLGMLLGFRPRVWRRRFVEPKAQEERVKPLKAPLWVQGVLGPKERTSP